MRSARFVAIVLFCLIGLPHVALALSADELLLIVNRNEPHGTELAHFYAQQRKVPEGRIVAVDLPPGDDITFEQFESNVTVPVRRYLREHKLESKVTCLVTFYGMPLRVRAAEQTPLIKAELAAVTDRARQVQEQLTTTTQSLDALAARLLPGGLPAELPDEPLARAEALLNATAQAADRIPDRAQRRKALSELLDLVEALSGDAGTMKRRRINDVEPSTRPAGQKDSITLELELIEGQKQLATYLDDRSNPASRAEARKLSVRYGLPAELATLQQQRQWLTPAKNGSALDNELAMLNLRAYTRDQWFPNLLRHTVSNYKGPRVMMVCRVDGPSVEKTREMITTSIAVEARGLRGIVAIDAGFGNGNPVYGAYDKTLLNLAQLVQDKTELSMVLDRGKGLMPLNRAKNVALYCGWYSVRKYVPTSKFAPGAVGFHVASFELVSLHDPEEKGWCRGLMNDGVVGTLGPVAEPFLHSFPPADEFFPLLMTGRLTLAEVYWKTTTLSSWMQALVGDPLYNPYKVNPALAVEDVPASLRKALP